MINATLAELTRFALSTFAQTAVVDPLEGIC